MTLNVQTTMNHNKMPQLQQQNSVRSPDERIGSAFHYIDEGI